jgi:hypothetical protein
MRPEAKPDRKTAAGERSDNVSYAAASSHMGTSVSSRINPSRGAIPRKLIDNCTSSTGAKT